MQVNTRLIMTSMYEAIEERAAKRPSLSPNSSATSVPPTVLDDKSFRSNCVKWGRDFSHRSDRQDTNHFFHFRDPIIPILPVSQPGASPYSSVEPAFHIVALTFRFT